MKRRIYALDAGCADSTTRIKDVDFLCYILSNVPAYQRTSYLDSLPRLCA